MCDVITSRHQRLQGLAAKYQKYQAKKCFFHNLQQEVQFFHCWEQIQKHIQSLCKLMMSVCCLRSSLVTPTGCLSGTVTQSHFCLNLFSIFRPFSRESAGNGAGNLWMVPILAGVSILSESRHL